MIAVVASLWLLVLSDPFHRRHLSKRGLKFITPILIELPTSLRNYSEPAKEEFY